MKRLLALGTSVFACSTSAGLAAPTLITSAGYTSWSVPYAGNWELIAGGAQGGSGANGGEVGGYGAKVLGTFYLAGGSLTIAVGGVGTGTTGGSGGGGGGTFVYNPGTSKFLLIAGGGGGVGASAAQNGIGGSSSQFGQFSSGTYTFGGGGNIVEPYGTPGYAGGPAYGSGYHAGSGGGAKAYNGYADSPYSTGGGGWGSAYGSLASGTVSGSCSLDGSGGYAGAGGGVGGFGGGGGGSCYGGGGGGGYRGGEGGIVAGGGGSFVANYAANTHAYSGTNPGGGYFYAKFIPADSGGGGVPEPATLALLGVALTGLGLARRRSSRSLGG